MTRRDSGRPRGQAIEDAILDAALAELAKHGAEGLSIPRIAKETELNKTSIYRRFPSKEALVAAALERALLEISGALVPSKDLRGDLDQILRLAAARLEKPGGQAVLRAAMHAGPGGAVDRLAQSPMMREQGDMLAMVLRAVERGEWDPTLAPDAVLGMLIGGLVHRLMLERQPLSDAWRATVIGVVVRGVRPMKRGEKPEA